MSSNTYTIRTRAVSGGRSTSGTGASASAGGFAPASSGVTEHSELSGRGLADQHPISAVAGLQAALDGKVSCASPLEIRFVTAYPATLENGVLYIRLSHV